VAARRPGGGEEEIRGEVLIGGVYGGGVELMMGVF